MWSNLVQFRVTTDSIKVVLEITPESGKTTSDSEVCTLRNLMHEMEEEGFVDIKVKNHSCERPGAGDQGKPSAPLHHSH